MTMNKMLNKIKYWSQLLLIPIYALTYIMPRSKKIWVFGSTFGRRFADNPKYFYLYVIQNQSSNVRAIWISKEKNIVEFLRGKKVEAYYLYSIKGFWFSLRAKVYIYDNYSKDICYTLSGGAKKFNLWHGIPLKKIAKDNVFDRVRNPRNLREKISSIPRRISDEKPTDYVLVPSEYLIPIFSSAFNTKNTIVCGYPRNDILISDSVDIIMTVDEKHICNMIENQAKNNKIILYMPTFRESEHKFFEVISIAEFETFLRENDFVLFVKLHPKSKINDKFMEVQSEYIKIINPEHDPYPLLRMVDVLVTDYSSIYFDFLLTDKPIIFFPYDLKEYLMESREMYFDYDEFTPGKKVFVQKELENALLELDGHHDNRNRIIQKVFDLEHSNTGSENLYMYILNILHMNGKD